MTFSQALVAIKTAATVADAYAILKAAGGKLDRSKGAATMLSYKHGAAADAADAWNKIEGWQAIYTEMCTAWNAKAKGLSTDEVVTIMLAA